jgi:hypothetical protein
MTTEEIIFSGTNKTARSLVTDALINLESQNYGEFVTELIAKLDSAMQTSLIYITLLKEHQINLRDANKLSTDVLKNSARDYIINQINLLIPILKEKIFY